MAEVRFQLGASADIATSDEVRTAVGTVHDRLDSMKVSNPIIRQLRGSVTLPGGSLSNGASLVLPVGPDTPSVGRIWNIVRFTLMVQDDFTTTANLDGALYVGNPGNFSAGDCVYPCTPSATVASGMFLPKFEDFNKDIIWCLPGESVFVLLRGNGNTVTSSLPIVANLTALEYVSGVREASRV